MSHARVVASHSATRWCFAALLFGCQTHVSGSAAPQSAQNPARVSPRPPPSAAYQDPPPALPQTPSCTPGQVAWQPAHCSFVACGEDGHLGTPSSDTVVDCLHPLSAYPTFNRNAKTLSVKQLAELENLAARADVLHVTQLNVLGLQDWDETPDLHAQTPLSLERANVVRAVLAAVTHIPVVASDGGTKRRRNSGNDDPDARVARVTMAPLDASHLPPATAPFSLPWSECESGVTFRTVLTMTTHDDIVVVEICRNGKCSRAALNAQLLAVWPGGEGSVMIGDFKADLALEPTEEQQIQNGKFELGTGEGPASFNLRVSMHDASISENDKFRFRIYRRRTEVMLDSAGPLEFRRTPPHPTRDVPPCLNAVQEVRK